MLKAGPVASPKTSTSKPIGHPSQMTDSPCSSSPKRRLGNFKLTSTRICVQSVTPRCPSKLHKASLANRSIATAFTRNPSSCLSYRHNSRTGTRYCPKNLASLLLKRTISLKIENPFSAFSIIVRKHFLHGLQFSLSLKPLKWRRKTCCGTPSG